MLLLTRIWLPGRLPHLKLLLAVLVSCSAAVATLHRQMGCDGMDVARAARGLSAGCLPAGTLGARQ